METPKLEQIALILAEAIHARDDKATAQKHGKSLRTLQRWREKADADPALAQLVAEKLALLDQRWAEKIPSAMEAALDYIERACRSTQIDSSMLYSVTGALKVISEIQMARRMIDARLNRAAQAPGTPAGSASAGSVRPLRVA